MYAPKAQTEIFHLLFLRQFSAQIDANLYAIKGGCNLRFFFDSVRQSEDLDIDVVIIQKQTLENKVDKILSSQSFLKLLQGYGITQLKVTSPKQTQTTQRWKIQFYAAGAEIPCHTKIEFSRRNEALCAKLGNVSMKICQVYHLTPIRLSHYELKEALMQKILALASRSLTQARDIFDIYHLLHIEVPPVLTINKSILMKAKEALLSINFNDYRSQVVNFLDIKEQQIFNSRDYWTTISKEVLNYLNGLEL